MFVKSNTLPRVGEKMILIGCDGERCESTIVEICKPEAMSMYVVEDGDGTRFWVYDARTCDCGSHVSNEWSRVVGDPAENVSRPAVDTLTIACDITVGNLIKKLRQLDESQTFRVQIILPDGSAIASLECLPNTDAVSRSEPKSEWPFTVVSIRKNGGKE